MIFVTILMMGCRCPRPPADSDARLLAAIRKVESNDHDLAVNSKEQAYGAYQCRRGAWLDGGGAEADWPQQAFVRERVEIVMRRYWERYDAVTDEQKARIWNGGPGGMRKKTTLAYWRKVQEAMK
jgi:hypothetical protein